jgi:HEAT repeat protein
MRHFILPALLLALVAGCSKKQPVQLGNGADTNGTPADPVATERTRLLTNLKGANEQSRQEAMDELAAWVDSDPETVAALLEMLKDKTTAGLGKTHPMRVTSTREAAARTLSLAGPKGEAALKDKGFALLRDGLNDLQPAVREHTAYTIGLLGPLARPLSADVMKLCTNPEPKVRGAAFDALRAVGITDAAGFARLLLHENEDVALLASELAAGLTDVSDEAIAPLTSALGSPLGPVRLAAATALAAAGPKAASAAGPLVDAIKKNYPAAYDPQIPFEFSSTNAYWRALARVGEPAAPVVATLLTHTNAVVRGLAAQTLGEIGPPAKASADKLKDALKDQYGFVAVEAACALCRIGTDKDEAVALVRRAIKEKTSVAMIAIDAIPRMGDAGKPLVADALAELGGENPYARFAAVGLVGTLPPVEATKAAASVGKLATDPEPEIRRRVGFVLEQLGPAAAPAAEALGKALAGEKDEVIREQFVDALVAMRSGAKPALPSLLPLATDKSLSASRRTRVLAAVAVADPTAKETATALLIAANDGDQFVRAAAAGALGKLNPLPPDALAALVKIAKTDRSTHARLAALRALAEAGPRVNAARGDIDAIANGPRQDGQALAAKVTVAAMDGDKAKAAAAVRAGLSDKKADVRVAAAIALVAIGPTADDLPALLKLLKDRGSDTREAAARGIGRLGAAAKDAVPPLIKLLDDPSGEVRIAAAEALGDLGPAALAAVEKLKEARRNDPTAESAARKALEKLGVKEEGPRR